MSCFKTHIATAAVTEPDPTKHVNYQLGMVLGVEDFNQEFAYLAGRDQWLARDLIGYGTVRGLRVHYENDGSKGPRVVVDAGAALSPSGQLICVPAAQCASLNDWLAANAKAVSDHIGSPVSSTLPLYVVLCYRECPTDEVPIPGEPCRSEDDLKAPSRITDGFQLELRFDPPKQREEDAVRDFVAWLRQVEISDAVVGSTPIDQFLQAIQDAALPWLSPPSSPIDSPPSDFMFGSPPAALQIRPEDACEYLSAAFRLWVTELRPKWYGRWHGCAAEMKGDSEDCVLLGQVDTPVLLDLPGSWVVSDVTKVTVNSAQSPYIVHLRMLQEWLLCNLMNADPTQTLKPSVTVVAETSFGQAPSAGASSDYSRADHTHGTPTLLPGDSVTSETTFGQAPVAGNSLAYSRANHSHGTPALPNLDGDVTGTISVNLVNRLLGVTLDAAPPTPALNQVLTVTNAGGNLRWRAANVPTTAPTLGGDVTGLANATTVARIRGVDVDTTTPAAGQVLTATSAPGGGIRWQPAAVPVTGGSFVRADFTPASGIRDYAIVAAGLVRANGTSTGRIYNGLKAGVATNSEILISFTGYRQPDPTNPRHQYIVKALIGFNEGLRIPIVVFRGFQTDGILLRVTDGGSVIPANIFLQVELMIEVSQYFA